MKILLHIGAKLILCCSLVVLAACSGGGGGDSSTTSRTVDDGSGDDGTASVTTLSGTVADGYLRDARVFLDRNGNRLYDNGEPTAQSGNGGLYSLEVNPGEGELYSVIVEVIAGQTVDEDTGVPVTDSYLMESPPGHWEFISPITTLVRIERDKNPLFTEQQALLSVRSQFGIADEASLFSDYLATGGVSGVLLEEYGRTHKAAQVIAQLLGRLRSEILLNLGGQIADGEQALVAYMISDQILGQADIVKQALDDERNLGTTADVVALTNTAIAEINIANLDADLLLLYQQRLDQNLEIWDMQPPQLLSQYPPPNDNAPVDAIVSLIFDELLDETLLGSSLVQLSGPYGAVAGNLDYDVEQKRLIFTPSNWLLPFSTYQITLSGQLSDSLGNPLVDDMTWSFATIFDKTPPPSLIFKFNTNNGYILSGVAVVGSTAALNEKRLTMNVPAYLLFIPGSPMLSLLFCFIISSTLLYLARKPAHEAIISVCRVLSYAFRLASRSLLSAEKRLKDRNREVLLAEGQAASERIIEREFERINVSVTKNMSAFPALQRRISDTVTQVDEDYRNSVNIPPEPPGWGKVLEPIAKIPAVEDSMVAEVLKSIRAALEKSQQGVLEVYRKNSRERHLQLKKVAPNLCHIEKGLGEVNLHIKGLLERTGTIDNHMVAFEQMSKGCQKAEQRLSSSSLTQFFISGFVLAIAIGGAMINFNLIARPMQEMVGGSVHMMGFRVADIAALVIILVEISMGLFLMESLRITRLFPVIGALDDKIRVRMIIVSFAFLFLLASIESGLAYMRELLSQDDAALIAGLLSSGANSSLEMSGRWITTAAQMGMGFVLPFALTFVAIPLESFFYSLRTVLGITLVGFLHLSAGLFRLLSNLSRYGGKCLVSIYDLLVFLPLWVESKIVRINRSADAAEGDDETKMSKSTRNRSGSDIGSSVSIKLPRKSSSRKRTKKDQAATAGQTQEVLS